MVFFWCFSWHFDMHDLDWGQWDLQQWSVRHWDLRGCKSRGDFSLSYFLAGINPAQGNLFYTPNDFYLWKCNLMIDAFAADLFQPISICFNRTDSRFPCRFVSRELTVFNDDDVSRQICFNRIRDNAQHGVLVHDNGKGELRDNEIFKNKWEDIHWNSLFSSRPYLAYPT